jgi:cytochrome c biogenesis protein CcmG/thiol:disulfide interchange protein DsbE
LEGIWQRHRENGLSVVAVEAFQNREGATEFINDNMLTYHFLENLEGDREVVDKAFRVKGYPTTLVIDGQGRVVFFHYGFKQGDEIELEKEVKKLLAEE